jgi:hypothetical protein
MKTNLKIVLLLASVAIFSIVLSGCYTQLQSTRGTDYPEDEGYATTPAQTYASDTVMTDSGAYYGEQGQTTINNYYGDDWNTPNYRFGFSYYYPATYWPSAYFGVAYNDPYYYDYYVHSPAIYCGPFYHHYDPYYYSSYYPYYGYGYGGAYYYNSGYNNGGVRRPVRSFGSSRGTTNGNRLDIDRSSTGGGVNASAPSGRAMGGSNDLPIGSVPTGLSSGRAVGKAPATATPRSGNRNSGIRSDIRRYAPNASGSSRNAVRSSRAPNLAPVNPGGRRVESSATPNVAPAPSNSGRSSAQPSVRSTPTPSYSPRPASAPRSSPPPASGGGARSGSGSSSGSARPSGGGRRP